LAPENPFPAAVHDSWEVLLWLQTTGHNLLSLNLSKLAIAGSSAGANLAAVMTQKAAALPHFPKFLIQLLPLLKGQSYVPTIATVLLGVLRQW